MVESMLIIDDSATMRKIIKRSVRQADLFAEDHIFEAGNGVEALDSIKSQSVDLILCDINMPEMDGVEFVKEARKMSCCIDTKIVMITTESSPESIEQAKKGAADGYITKPFTAEDIKKELTMILS